MVIVFRRNTRAQNENLPERKISKIPNRKQTISVFLNISLIIRKHYNNLKNKLQEKKSIFSK